VDYYKLLGVNFFATQDDITEGYKKMARDFHPTKYVDPFFDDIQDTLAEYTQKLIIAYQTLIDEENRGQYNKAIRKELHNLKNIVKIDDEREIKDISALFKTAPISLNQSRGTADWRKELSAPRSIRPSGLPPAEKDPALLFAALDQSTPPAMDNPDAAKPLLAGPAKKGRTIELDPWQEDLARPSGPIGAAKVANTFEHVFFDTSPIDRAGIASLMAETPDDSGEKIQESSASEQAEVPSSEPLLFQRDDDSQSASVSAEFEEDPAQKHKRQVQVMIAIIVILLGGIVYFLHYLWQLLF
jgi:curved DNA-binding protein CbpA